MTTIISGTNREGSNTLKLAEYYHRQLSEKGFDSEIFSLCDLPGDLISSDLYGKRSEAFQSIQERITASSKFIFVIPEYNGSFPGVLKTFIDACTFPESFLEKRQPSSDCQAANTVIFGVSTILQESAIISICMSCHYAYIYQTSGKNLMKTGIYLMKTR
jgi:NAD(P)H-dependent FMN reductase